MHQKRFPLTTFASTCCLLLPLLLLANASIVPGTSRNLQKSQDEEATEIELLLTSQVECWNKHDLDGFMKTYWKSEDMSFSGGGTTRRGWQATFDSYQKSYPGEKMGKLHFENLEVEILGEKAAFVLGEWFLDMSGEKKNGNFTLVIKKIDGEWKIVHDHSSTLEPQEKEKAKE